MTLDCKLAIYGAGAWGTALGIAYASTLSTTLVTRSQLVADQMLSTHENQQHLPGYSLPQQLSISGCIEHVLGEADIIIVATPVAAFDDALKEISKAKQSAVILFACKGLHHKTSETLTTQAQLSTGTKHTWGVLSGPSFAQGVAAGHPTAFTVATTGSDAQTLDTAKFLSTGSLRCYASGDLAGVQVCGALKNIYAIAAGAIDGAGWSENTRAALLARAINEMFRFAGAHGAVTSTLMGLSGLGDLHLTCSSGQSRNYRVGRALALGKSIEEALGSLGHVAEGVATTNLVCAKAEKLGLEMPIAKAVSQLIAGRLTVHEAIGRLLSRDIKFEESPIAAF